MIPDCVVLRVLIQKLRDQSENLNGVLPVRYLSCNIKSETNLELKSQVTDLRIDEIRQVLVGFNLLLLFLSRLF